MKNVKKGSRAGISGKFKERAIRMLEMKYLSFHTFSVVQISYNPNTLIAFVWDKNNFYIRNSGFSYTNLCWKGCYLVSLQTKNISKTVTSY